jgi:hypothetical protein
VVIVRVLLLFAFAFCLRRVVVFLRPVQSGPPLPMNQLSSPPLSLRLSLHHNLHHHLNHLLQPTTSPPPLSSSLTLCPSLEHSSLFCRVCHPAPSGPHRLVGLFSTARARLKHSSDHFLHHHRPGHDLSNQPSHRTAHDSPLELSPCSDPSNLQPTSSFCSSTPYPFHRRRLHLACRIASHRIAPHRISPFLLRLTSSHLLSHAQNTILCRPEKRKP